jgi:hypothetical protein
MSYPSEGSQAPTVRGTYQDVNREAWGIVRSASVTRIWSPKRAAWRVLPAQACPRGPEALRVSSASAEGFLTYAIPRAIVVRFGGRRSVRPRWLQRQAHDRHDGGQRRDNRQRDLWQLGGLTDGRWDWHDERRNRIVWLLDWRFVQRSGVAGNVRHGHGGGDDWRNQLRAGVDLHG